MADRSHAPSIRGMSHSSRSSGRALSVYATCPRAVVRGADAFGASLTQAARWTEEAGLRGLLVFSDNGSVDPWVVAQHLLERTTSIVPLIAVQPEYTHPFTAARTVAALSRLHQRPVDLNLVTGSYGRDLVALGCGLDHDERYERLLAFGRILHGLLHGADALTHHSAYYDLAEATIYPSLPRGCRPRVFVAGSSAMSARVAGALRVTRLMNPKPPGDYAEPGSTLDGTAIRIGVIARESSELAWRIARQRYPDDRAKQRFHSTVVPSYEAQWLRDAWDASSLAYDRPDVYWAHPFRVSGEYCSYLVGSYDEVGEVLARYLGLGVTDLVLSTPFEEDDLHHAIIAVRRAEEAGRGDAALVPASPS